MFAIDTFKNVVYNFYKAQNELGQLSANLEKPSPANLKKECLNLLRSERFKEDEAAIRNFFDPNRKCKDLEECIEGFELNKFKPLRNFLTGNTIIKDAEGVKLIALLINFEPRSYDIWKREHQELERKKNEKRDEHLSLSSEHDVSIATPVMKVDDVTSKALCKTKLSSISTTASQEADYIEKIDWSSKREIVHLSDVYIEREIESSIEAEIKENQHRFIFLEGDAGNGKTSVLWHQYQKYQNSEQFEGYNSLFLKSTQLREINFDTIQMLANQELALQPLIFLDTIDLLLHDTDDRERLIAFYDLIFRIDGICVSCCRPQEISSLNSLKKTFIKTWKVLEVKNYSDTELEEAIRKYAKIYYEQAPDVDVEKKIAEILFDSKNDKSLKPIYANPLTNRMLFTLYAPVPIVESINVFKLYEDFWQKRVVEDVRIGITAKPRQRNASKNLSKAASFIALFMLATGNVTLNKKTIKRHANWYNIDDDEVTILIDRGILKGSNNSEEFEFFHQTFFEHAAAKAFIDLIKMPAIGILAKKIFDEKGQPTPESFFLSPILEHLLLLAESSPINNLAEKCCLSLIKSTIAEQIRIGLYVYALNATRKPSLDQAVHKQLEAFDSEQATYIKRFLQVAVNIAGHRITDLFLNLDVIWENGNWNIRYNVIELLDYLALKAPRETLHFLDRHDIVNKTAANFNIRGVKREHLPSFKELVRILIVLAINDLNFAKKNLFAIATVNDLSVNRYLLTITTEHKIFIDDIPFFRELYDLWLDIFNKNQDHYKAPNHDNANLLSDVLAICWLNRMPDIPNLLVQLKDETIKVKKCVELMTLAKVARRFTKSLAEMVFIYFKTNVEKEDIFNWSKYLIPFYRSANEYKHLLMDLFLTDIAEYLKQEVAGVKFNDRDSVILSSYRASIERIDQDAPQYLFDFFEPFYLKKEYLEKTPELVRLMLFSYLNGNILTINLIENPDIDFYANNIEVSKQLTSTINDKVIFTEKIFNFFVELCILKGELRLLAAQLERICPDIFVNNDDIPAYLFNHGEKLHKAALKAIKTRHPKQCADGAHLLAMLLKIGLIDRPSLKEVNNLFPDERRVDILSWLFEIFPFCRHDTLSEATAILEKCNAFFDHKIPNLQEKSRCAFLRFIFESDFNFESLQEKILATYYDKREIDKNSKRIKIINRILIKYADLESPMSFHILYDLLNSDTLQNYNQSKQNETSHELHNGCVHICTKLKLEYLTKLASLLKSTSCDYGRLILNGLSADDTKLGKLMLTLNEIKSLPQTLPCLQNKLAHILPHKLKTSSSNEWPELLDYINT